MNIVFDLIKLLIMPFALYIKVLSWCITWDDVPRTYPSWAMLFCYGLTVGIICALVEGSQPITSALSMTLSVAFCLFLFRKPGILLILAGGIG